jgi:hypothetical protein
MILLNFTQIVKKSSIFSNVLYPAIPLGQKLLESVEDELLEHLPNIFRSDIKVFPYLTLLNTLLNHLLMVPAALIQVDLVTVVLAVFANLPKRNSSNSITPNIEFSAFVDLLAHLYHCVLLCFS